MSDLKSVRKEEGPYKRVKFVTVEDALEAFREANLYHGAENDLMSGKTVRTAHDNYRLVRTVKPEERP